MATLTLAQISDRIEIDDLLTRYATAVDNRDWDLYSTCFTEHAYIDYTAAGGVKGELAEVRAWLEKTMAMFPMSQHVVCNRDISIDGDTATCRSVFYNPMALPDEPDSQKLFIEGGYYNDRLVRTADGWRIRERIEDSSYSTLRQKMIHPQ
jgi:3-phenylpropionate/cinnamic acid dioxygenase small subunit